MTNTFLYLALSGFTIWFIQSQKIFDKLFFNEFLKELRHCKICLGFWVCVVLFPAFGVGLLPHLNVYIGLVDWVVTSMISSFVIFLIFSGWQARYGVTHV